MKILYRHSDGRLIEVAGDSSKAEVWLLCPQRELLKTEETFEKACNNLPDGFELDGAKFSPPCPKCGSPSAMSLDTGMYVCAECESIF